MREQLAREVVHWSTATDQLGDVSRFASVAAWRSLERYLDVALETALRAAVDRLRRQCGVVKARLLAAETEAELQGVHRELLAYRRHYFTVETMLNFYGQAINTRTTPAQGSYLGACDFLARESLRLLLEPLGLPTPPVLTYLDMGLGASIMKYGLRLWDGRSLSPVAAVKLVHHSVSPTSLIHETGHQAAHQLGWLAELAAALERGLGGQIGKLWAGWASETAADAYAFVHTGYASVVALHDVLAGEPEAVLHVQPLDPHPTGYLRVLLGHAMCRRFFGAGPWDVLAQAWTQLYRLADADEVSAPLLAASVPALPTVVELVLARPYRALRGKSLAERIDPARVRPDALEALARSGGNALTRSSDWIRRESLRLLALSGYRMASAPERSGEVLREQQDWMQALGRMAAAA